MNRDTALAAFCARFNKLDKNCTEILCELYTDDVIFQDPLHRIEGLESLEKYFKALYENVTGCRFEFHQQALQGEAAFVSWTMHLSHRRLASGRQISLEGCSVLCFPAHAEGRASRHRDHFDLGALLYENLPLLGPLVKGVKRRAGS
ncbi:nuclear transport factor 2 family protein [Halomonas sp. E14]|uniref:nuclear transport factor 2 family protein n=1 Tax=Halomonas sp. E14 TaxID=3397245 RepID=UPI00403E9AAF